MTRLTPSGMPLGKPFPENELVWLDCPECEYHVRVHQSTQEANMRQHKEKGCPLVTTGDATPEVENRSPLELQASLCPEPCGNACTCVNASEPLSRDPSLPSNWYDRLPLAPATSPEPVSRKDSPKVETTPSHSWEPLRKALSEEKVCKVEGFEGLGLCQDDCAQVGFCRARLTSADEEKYAGYLANVNKADADDEHCNNGCSHLAGEEHNWKPVSAPTILEEAGELVDGPREAHYGHPYDDFSRAIGAFNALFEDYLKQPLEVRHWPLIMQLVKLSREINEPKRDNWVDGAGYWRTLEKVMDHEDEGQYR